MALKVQIRKSISKHLNPLVNIILNAECFASNIKNKTQMFALTTCINTGLEALASAIRQEKERKFTWTGRNAIAYICRYDYLNRKYQTVYKKLLELIT